MINGVSQISKVMMGTWDMTAFSTVADDHEIKVYDGVGAYGIFDLSITSLDGSVSTLPQALTVNPQ